MIFIKILRLFALEKNNDTRYFIISNRLFLSLFDKKTHIGSETICYYKTERKIGLILSN